MVLGAVVIAVVAFVVLQPTDTEPAGERAGSDSAGATTETDTGPGAATDTRPEEPSPPEVTRIQIRAGVVVGGAPRIEARKGEILHVVVTSDVADEIHLHGYDITRAAAPGKPATFHFTAGLEGVFEMESHQAEDAGKDPLVARLAVGPA